MTTWTTISNASVAVGGIPSSTTITALRDNPIAISEAASGSPVIVNGWHPVDKVTVGDGKAGLIYDAAVNGTVSSIITPDFVDGYEYRLFASGLGPTATSAGFVCDVWGDGAAAYVDVLGGDGAAATNASLQIDFPTARLSKQWHGSPLLFARGSVLGAITRWSLYRSNGQKILRVRLRFSTGSIDTGKVWLSRRREFASSP